MSAFVVDAFGVDLRKWRSWFVARLEGKDNDHYGEHLEIDRPRRLVFTLCVPAAWSGTSRAQVDIVPNETGCELTLTHQALVVELAAAVEKGWTIFLNLLHGRKVRSYRAGASEHRGLCPM